MAWLAKLDQSKLGVVSEAAAKAAWLAKIDEAKMGSGKVVPTSTAIKAEPVATPSSEGAEAKAKAAWLAKIDQQ